MQLDLGNPRFMDVSFVETHIRSQWQAHFMQVFPIGMSDLPMTHPSDEAFFNQNWRGPKEQDGAPMTYQRFMLLHYPDYIREQAVG
jgi:hypothetical protein